jgi:hypothetical protein
MTTRLPYRASLRRRGVIAAIVAAGALGLAAAPAGAVVTVSQSGSPGAWAGSDANTCTGKPRQITTGRSSVTGSPAYPNSYQSVYMIPKYEYSGDGTNWYDGGWGTWQGVQTFGQRTVRFDAQTANISLAGYYWRVKMVFRWYVGDRQVGEVTNLFDRSGNGWGDYWAGAGAATASNRAGGFCLIY